MPGLDLTTPAGWSSPEDSPGELQLVPPGQPNSTINFWLDMIAIKSTDPGHGEPLTNVGRTPSDLIAWLTNDPDFLVVSAPAPITIGQGITMTSLVIGVSRTANYGDPGCPANPRCADLFTSTHWRFNDTYGIGGDGEVRLYLGTIQMRGNTHNFVVALDASDNADLLHLEEAAQPILVSVRLPPGTVSA